ncbi:hypothetical protein [Methanoculleus sp. 7T]|uniref:hypothetical protein n=1 Tax=Methanoculleus sp. 7T TaxID=2937282 RepID=UPI0020BE9693|nr:hypothetical protein [Methanoculleus sp. 7T]
MIRLSGKLSCSIILVLGFAGLLLAHGIACAEEDVVVNTTTSSGKIIFQENASHGVYALAGASADFGTDMVLSNSISSIETGTGKSVFTATWRNDQKNEFGSAKTAIFTLTVWDPTGLPRTATRETGRVNSGTLSVSCFPFEPGEGRFEFTSTIREKRLSLSAAFDR